MWQVKLCDPSLTRRNLGALEMSIDHIIERYTKLSVMFTLLSVSPEWIDPGLG